MLFATHTTTTFKAAAASTCKPSAVSRPAARLPPLRVRATPEAAQAEASAPPASGGALDFTPSTQAASGYVAFDTAGQENMYPVLTKAYEAGSEADTLETQSANLVVGVGAGFIAAAVLVVGLAALSQQGGSAATDATLEGLKSLSEYAAAFSADL